MRELTIGPWKFRGYKTDRYFSLIVLRGRWTPDGWTWDEE